MSKRTRKPPRRKAKQRRAIETVDAILTGGGQVLKRYGYTGATTVRIAERAGVSVGSLYQYFASKDQVFEELFEREAERLAKNLRSFEENPDRPLSTNLQSLLSLAVYSKDLDPPLLHELARIPAFERRIRGLREGAVGAIYDFLRPHASQLAVIDARAAVELLVLSAVGVGIGATREMLDGGILDRYNEMAVSYLLGERVCESADDPRS